MAHWLYIAFETSIKSSINGSSYLTGSTAVTGFPIYTLDKELILTEENPGKNIGVMRFYEYDSTPAASDYYAGIMVDSLITIEGRHDESIGSDYASYTRISPVKLFRVESATSVDSYGTRYEDVQIKGRYLIRDIPNFLFNGFIIPVKYLHKGEIKDGIGNYNTSQFQFSSLGWGITSEENQSIANTTRAYIANASAMAPKAIKRQEAYSNRLVMSDISVGDVIDFGPDYQNVPSILKTWLDNSCQNITDSAEPVVFELTNTAGIRLFTEEKYSYWDMKVVPKLEERELTENGEYKVNAGFAGISKVIVKVPTTQKTADFEWTLRETLDFSMIPSDLLGEIHFVYFSIPEAELYASTPFIGLRISEGAVTAIQYGDNISTEVVLYDAESGWADTSYRTLHTYASAMSGILYAFLSGNAD